MDKYCCLKQQIVDKKRKTAKILLSLTGNKSKGFLVEWISEKLYGGDVIVGYTFKV